MKTRASAAEPRTVGANPEVCPASWVRRVLAGYAAFPQAHAQWRAVVLWSLVGGAAFHAAYASAWLAPLVVLYLFALVQLARAPTRRKAFYPGLALGLLVGVPRLGFFWTIFSAGAVALWLVFAVWVGLFAIASREALRTLPGRWGWLAVPFVWTGLEYFRSELYYLKFSWLSPGYAYSDATFMVPLGHVGTYGVGFVLMLLAILAALQSTALRRFSVLSLGTAVLWGWGTLALPSEGGTARQVQVAGVQLEFPTEDEVLLRLRDVVRRHPEAELLVLSEYTFTGPIPARVRDWCREHQRHLIVGGTQPLPGGQFYNTAFVIGPDGKDVFRQVKGVPIQFFKDGLPAPEHKTWQSPWGRIGLCICYDLSYTRITDRLVRDGAEALIVPTMDVKDWGQAQHELHARVTPVRAAEYGIPIFRIASSGVSQMVDWRGRVLGKTPCGEGQVLSGTLDLTRPGRLPIDRWVGPAAVALTSGLLVFWVLGSLARLFLCASHKNSGIVSS